MLYMQSQLGVLVGVTDILSTVEEVNVSDSALLDTINLCGETRYIMANADDAGFSTVADIPNSYTQNSGRNKFFVDSMGKRHFCDLVGETDTLDETPYYKRKGVVLVACLYALNWYAAQYGINYESKEK